jgi:lysozyme family protein
MSNFLKAVEKVLKHEGGFVNHPADRGGATNWGITQKTYEKFMRRPVTVDEIRRMPKGNAVAIYKEDYWDKVGGDKIKKYAIAFVLFDQAVNRGHNRAIKQAQKILGLYQDGIIGPKTIAAINDTNETEFLNKYLAESEKAYRSIASANPSQVVFLKGWLNRVESLRDYAFNNLTTVGIGLVGIGIAVALAYFISQQTNRLA